MQANHNEKKHLLQVLTVSHLNKHELFEFQLPLRQGFSHIASPFHVTHQRHQSWRGTLRSHDIRLKETATKAQIRSVCCELHAPYLLQESNGPRACQAPKLAIHFGLGSGNKMHAWIFVAPVEGKRTANHNIFV